MQQVFRFFCPSKNFFFNIQGQTCIFYEITTTKTSKFHAEQWLPKHNLGQIDESHSKLICKCVSENLWTLQSSFYRHFHESNWYESLTKRGFIIDWSLLIFGTRWGKFVGVFHTFFKLVKNLLILLIFKNSEKLEIIRKLEFF